MKRRRCSMMAGVVVMSLCAFSLGQSGGLEQPRSTAPEKRATGISPAGMTKLTREGIQRALDNARKGDSRELATMASSVLAQKDLGTGADLRPDFEALLADTLPEAQCLGARGLFALKNPQSKQALMDYLKGKEKNLRSLNEFTSRPNSAPGISPGEVLASAFAVQALGEVGDRSAIPLLESLQGIRVMGVEWGGLPVEEALVKLGSFKSLTALGGGDDPVKISHAANTIRRISDPSAAPDLRTAVRDRTVAEEIRVASVEALGSIRTGADAGFLIMILEDANVPARMRRVAAIAAGRTGDGSVEISLKRYAEDDSSDVRADAFMGLVLLQPAVYLDRWFKTIMDSREDAKFRMTLAGKEFLIPRETLCNEKKRLLDCLGAVRDSGRPFDQLRVKFWVVINELFREEPQITLTSREDEVAAMIRYAVRARLRRTNDQLGRSALDRQVDDVLEKLIQVQ